MSTTKLSPSGSVNVFVNVLAATRGSLYVLGSTNTHVSVPNVIPIGISHSSPESSLDIKLCFHSFYQPCI